MVGSFSRVSLLGAVAERPRLRYGSLDLPMLEFKVAGEEQLEERTIIWDHRVILTGPEVARVREVLKKGQVVFVEGWLEVWTMGGPEEDPLSDGPSYKTHFEVVRTKQVRLVEGLEGEVLADQKERYWLRPALNEAILVGEVHEVSALEPFPDGNRVANLKVETRPGGKVYFLEVRAWNSLGEQATRLQKGDGVLVMGRLRNRTWMDKEGRKHRRSRVDALRIERLAPEEREVSEPPEVGVA